MKYTFGAAWSTTIHLIYKHNTQYIYTYMEKMEQFVYESTSTEYEKEKLLYVCRYMLVAEYVVGMYIPRNNTIVWYSKQKLLNELNFIYTYLSLSCWCLCFCHPPPMTWSYININIKFVFRSIFLIKWIQRVDHFHIEKCDRMFLILFKNGLLLKFLKDSYIMHSCNYIS